MSSTQFNKTVDHVDLEKAAEDMVRSLGHAVLLVTLQSTSYTFLKVSMTVTVFQSDADIYPYTPGHRSASIVLQHVRYLIISRCGVAWRRVQVRPVNQLEH